MLYARQTETTYETFEARCPTCQEWVVFNRNDDLGGADRIDFMEVNCPLPACRAPFAINGDTADPPFAQMLFSAYPLMDRKQYGEAILAICRAHEMFFAHAIAELLVWRPFVAEQYEPDTDHVNRLSAEVQRVIARRSFNEMRRAFVNVAVLAPVPSVSAGEAIIAQLPQFFRKFELAKLDACPNRQVARALHAVLDSDINIVRNAVVHASADRPNAQTAQRLFSYARDVIWDLADELEVRFEAL